MGAAPKVRCESPGSDAGRGLKLNKPPHVTSGYFESPGSDAGRGLKQNTPSQVASRSTESPGSDAGRGLKPVERGHARFAVVSRPAVMPGVD